MTKKRKTKKGVLTGFILDDDRFVTAEEYLRAVAKLKSAISTKKLIEAIDLILPNEGSRAVAQVEQSDEMYEDGDIVKPPIDVSLLESAFLLNSVHYRCCVIKAEDVTSKGFILEQKTTHTAKQDTNVDAKQLDREIKEAHDLIENCFEGRGGKAVVDALLIDQQSIGWGCCEVIRTVDGKIVDLIPHPAKTFRWTRDGFIIQQVGNKKVRFLPFGKKFIYKQTKRGRKLTDIVSIEPDAEKEPKKVPLDKSATEILWFNRYTSAGGVYGIPDIVSALPSLSNVTSIDDYLSKFFENNAVPQYAVLVEGVDEIDQSVIAMIKTYFKKELKGKPHSTMVLQVPMGGNIRFEKLSVEREGAFQETKKVSREDIYIAHGVPPARIGIIETSNLGAGSGLSQAESYKNGVVIPLQKLVAEQFWGAIFGKYGMGLMNIQLRYIELEVRDYVSLKEQHIAYLDRGVLTINEVRKELDYPPIPGGDRAFIKMTRGIVFIDELEDAKFIPPVNIIPSTVDPNTNKSIDLIVEKVFNRLVDYIEKKKLNYTPSKKSGKRR